MFTNLSFPYHPVMWLSLALLHGSLIVRAYGDLSLSFEVKQWGGMLNAAALVLFAVVALVTVLRANIGNNATRA